MTTILATICFVLAFIICYSLIRIASRSSREMEQFEQDCARPEDDEAWKEAERNWPRLRERLKREGYLKD